MNTIHVESEVGADGVLELRVPMATADARTRVMVTIEPLPQGESTPASALPDWHGFVDRTYGSCAGLGLEEPADLPLPQRDWSA